MIDKSTASLHEALSQIKDGSTVMIGGFGTAGQPAELIDGLIELGVKGLTIINNNAGNGDYGLAKLLKAGAVRKIICSFPRQSDSWVFDELYRAGKIELELVPQGNLACRIQAGLCAGKSHQSRLCLNQGASGRPLGQLGLQQIGAQLRPDYGHGSRCHYCSSV